MFVFWSKYASQSDYVRVEVETAINHKKKIVPVLLGDTELWNEIAEFQWVDFRGRISSIPFPNEAPKAAYGSFYWLTIPIIFAILFVSTLGFFGQSRDLLNIYSFMIVAVALVLLWLIWKVFTFIVRKVLMKVRVPVPPEPWFELAKELDVKARELVLP